MISVEFDKADVQRVLSAIQGVQNVIKVQGLDTMQWKCATDYYLMVVEAMNRRTSPRPAYSKRYRKWKYEYGWMGYPAPWRLKGDLMRSLGAYRFRDGYLGGVQPGAVDSGGKSWFGQGRKGPDGPVTSIEMYGTIEEKRRPLFEPTMEEYASGKWLERGDEMLQKIGDRWR